MNDNGWPDLIRKLRQVLTPSEWAQFCIFCRSICRRYDGADFSRLSLQELDMLSQWATRAREEAPSNVTMLK